MNTFIFTFIRVGRIPTVEANAVIKVTTSCETPNTTMDCLVCAISDWVRETPEGQALWEYTAEDLNIGDLSSHGTAGLQPFLGRHGIETFEILDVNGPVYGYDRVLYDPLPDEP